MPQGRPKITKPDRNQYEIVSVLRDIGYDVDDVHNLAGLYDIVVSGWSHFYECSCSVRVEIKALGETLNDTEEKYWEKQRHLGSLILARSPRDVMSWFGDERFSGFQNEK